MSRTSSSTILHTPAQVPAANPSLRSPSEDRWDQALDLLNNDDKVELLKDRGSKGCLDILEEALSIANEKKKLCREKQWTYTKSNGKVIIIRDLFEKLVEWVKRFKEVGDIIVSYDPGHAALPWAAVRFLLTIAIEDAQTFGSMIEGIEQVASLIARYRVVEELYIEPGLKDETGVEGAILELYVAILKFESSAIRFYEAKTGGKRLFTEP